MQRLPPLSIGAFEGGAFRKFRGSVANKPLGEEPLSAKWADAGAPNTDCRDIFNMEMSVDVGPLTYQVGADQRTRTRSVFFYETQTTAVVGFFCLLSRRERRFSHSLNPFPAPSLLFDMHGRIFTSASTRI